MNLTLGQKRKIVGRVEGSPTTLQFTSLGRSIPSAAGRGINEINQNLLGEQIRRRGQLVWSEGIYQTFPVNEHAYRDTADGGREGFFHTEPSGTVKGKDIPSRGIAAVDDTMTGRFGTGDFVGSFVDNRFSQLIGPGKLRNKPYTNPEFPYGTGWYHDSWRDFPGSRVVPIYGVEGDTDQSDYNYVFIGDFLERLPGRGLLETVNNENYSPTTIGADGTIINGAQLNVGFVKFVVQNVLAILGQNRRIMCRANNSGVPTNEVAIIQVEEDDFGKASRGEKKEGYLCQDVTYGHLFRPIADEEAIDTGPEISFTNFAMKNIVSVADIPIRRDIVENIINKNNTNMSLEQMIGELLQPTSLGIETGNIHVQCRQRASGGYELLQATKNFNTLGNEVDQEELSMIFRNKFPQNHFLLDYKHADSLIENLDLSCKFDPAIGLTFQRNAAAFAGNPDALLQFLSYEGVAEEFRQFLADEAKSGAEGSEMYLQIFATPAEGTATSGGRIEIHRQAFFDVPDSNLNSGKKLVSDTVMSAFLMQQPHRAQKLSALIQSEPGQNFATQLLANYMRQLTVTIHGTTNLSPFNSINVSGVLPSLEGLYLITGVRESITLSNFQTILEGILVRPRPVGDVGKIEHNYGKAESSPTGPG